jgi:pimeloyl-ACP methyl ester carboxylesterase
MNTIDINNKRMSYTDIGEGRVLLFGRPSYLEQLERIDAPTLVIVGEHDRPRPVPEARQMSEIISGAGLEVIEDAGHISAKEQPGRVNKVLSDFLSQRGRVGP